MKHYGQPIAKSRIIQLNICPLHTGVIIKLIINWDENKLLLQQDVGGVSFTDGNIIYKFFKFVKFLKTFLFWSFLSKKLIILKLKQK